MGVRELAYAIQLSGAGERLAAYWRSVASYRRLALRAEDAERSGSAGEPEEYVLDLSPARPDARLELEATAVREQLDADRRAIDVLVGRGFGVALRIASDRELELAARAPRVLDGQVVAEIRRRWFDRARQDVPVRDTRGNVVGRASLAWRKELFRQLAGELAITGLVLAHVLRRLGHEPIELDQVDEDDERDNPAPDPDARAKLVKFLAERPGATAYLICRPRHDEDLAPAGAEAGTCFACETVVFVTRERLAFLRPGAELVCVGCLGAIPERATILGPRPVAVEIVRRDAKPAEVATAPREEYVLELAAAADRDLKPENGAIVHRDVKPQNVPAATPTTEPRDPPASPPACVVEAKPLEEMRVIKCEKCGREFGAPAGLGRHRLGPCGKAKAPQAAETPAAVDVVTPAAALPPPKTATRLRAEALLTCVEVLEPLDAESRSMVLGFLATEYGKRS